MRIHILTLSIIIFLFLVGNGSCFENKQPGLNSLQYFSCNYAEARHKFLNASNAVNATVKSFKHPYLGPEGEELFTDIALIGPDLTQDIIVLGSGTHGVEGFAGSAIQTGLLSESVVSDKKLKSKIIMIHAINPHGFAHLRRWNEDNVDVNRNFADFSKPYPENTGYKELAEAVSPDSISFWSNIRSMFKIYRYRLANGNPALKQAISGGQYTHSKGLFYGGQKETWSNTTVRKIISRYLSNARRVVYIDVHTGLGEFGKAHIIIHENENSSAYKRAVGFWGNLLQTTHSEKSDCVYLPTTLKQAFPEILPSKEVTAVTLEFGTVSAFKVFWALRAENWLYHHGELNHPDADNIKTDLLHAFYPDDDDWKHQVWSQGKDAVIKVLQQLH